MHKLMFVAGPLALVAATPAAATQGMTCRTASGPLLELSLVFGARPSVMHPQLVIAGRRLPVVVAQSWIEDPEIRVDLYDPQLLRHELRLKVRRNGFLFDGSVWRGGQRRWVRCRES
ncbi:hypothetical protein ACFQPG_08040 [Sphingomonas sp. GCM10030256]|uniref:hypothetical protein n=1 Tax=Sphingomonas sp. GCM10030256 TaxID=3273427 RepID=UPI00360FCAC8